MATAFFTRAPSTIVTIPLTGQLEFTIPFEFLARKFVVVTLLGTDRKVLTLNTDYRFIAVNKISLERQPDGNYTRIELRRYTSATDRLVTFIDGSILRATDLNLSQVQTMHVAEEARDMTSDNIGVNDEGDLDARNRKIVNLADGENLLDAVNLGQLRQFDSSTAVNADKAKQSADNSKVSETNASNSEARCVVAEAKSISSAGTAMTAAADANRSKAGAELAQGRAEQAATKAEAAAAPAIELFTRIEAVEGTTTTLSGKVAVLEAHHTDWPQVGSTANGTWEKHEDGTLICEKTAQATTGITIADPTLYRTAPQTWQFPVPFVITPVVEARVETNAAYSWTAIGDVNTGTNSMSWVVWKPTQSPTAPVVRLRAVGRWK